MRANSLFYFSLEHRLLIIIFIKLYLKNNNYAYEDTRDVSSIKKSVIKYSEEKKRNKILTIFLV